jgi:hypothetical protein
MVDDLKSLKDNLFKVLAGRNQGGDDMADDDSDDDDSETEGSFIDSSAARAVISTIFARAGKSKDDVVQILAREIGMAVAGMLKQPLSELAKHQKLQITFEFVPKTKGAKGNADSGSGEQPARSESPRKDHPPRAAKARTKVRPKK